MRLVADIGGTKGNFALIDPAQPERLLAEATISSRGRASLAALVSAYLADAGQRPTRACLAVPGPVLAGHTVMANLGWEADDKDLTRELGFGPVRMINDLVATAYG